MTIYLDSTPLQLEIAPDPLQLMPLPEVVPLHVGQEQEVALRFQRLYGFADAVTAEWQLPAGLAGVTAEAGTAAAEQAELALKVKADAQAMPGRHSLTLRLSLKFNGVDLQRSVPIVVEISQP